MPAGSVSQSYLVNGALATSPRAPFDGVLTWGESGDDLDPAVERTGLTGVDPAVYNTGFYLRESGVYVVTAFFHVRIQFDAPVAWHGVAAGAIAFQGGVLIGT